jgi:2-oxoglutarate ferredoxin oxidoreductase subunit beta
VPDDYDVSDRMAAMTYIKDHAGEIVTGVLFADENVPDVHEMNGTPATALSKLPFEKLCPGAGELARLQESFR